MKEAFARMLYERHCQCRILRFEERARECILVAMANLILGQPKRKQHVRNPHGPGTTYTSAWSHRGTTRSRVI